MPVEEVHAVAGIDGKSGEGGVYVGEAGKQRVSRPQRRFHAPLRPPWSSPALPLNYPAIIATMTALVAGWIAD